MNYLNIVKFIKKVAGYNIPFGFEFFGKQNQDDIFNQSYMKVIIDKFNNPTIIINQYCLLKHMDYKYYQKATTIKCGLLHEIGHIEMGLHVENKGMKEYLAQKWAIERAQALELNKIKDQLQREILYWGNFSWNKEKYYRKYILASKIYENRNE